jgi:2-polyprenyl-3-methyl-5-hydroxy-6-metoxy-1,4-benzoquinol methylase
LGKLYESYYTHEGAPKHARGEASLAARLRWLVKFGHLPRRGGERRGTGLVLKALQRLTSFIFPPLIADLPADNAGRLLDVGCGDGDLIRAAQERGWNAEGVDFDPAGVELARSRGLNVHLGSLASQGYDAEQFDAIVMSHVVEHLADPISVLQECHRILKPGGRLVLATPNADSQFHREFRKHWVHLDPPRHLYVFEVNTLTEVVRRSGFNNSLKCFTVLGAPFAYGASQLIGRNGRFTARSGATAGINLRAFLMMLAELANLKAGRPLGEELRLVVNK